MASLTPLAAMILRGIDIAYPALHASSVLTPAAARLYPQTLTLCLNQLYARTSFGGLPLTQLVSPSANLAPIIRDLAASDPDRLRIDAPVLLEQGLADSTVFPFLDKALSDSLRGVGDSVSYHSYPGATHGSILVVAAADATAFIIRHFGGKR